MLDAYTDAFARYLRTGEADSLSRFCAEHADLSRLRVYRNGFLKACVEALRANYPSVERLAGEDRFPALARPYVEANPPRTASLVEYGDGFPPHIDDARDLHRLDYLASFATLDRAWSEIYFAEDEDERTAGPGGILDDGEALMGLRGRLSPRARLVSLDYRVLDVWSALLQGDLRQRIEIRRMPQRILVWRNGAGRFYRDLTLPEHAFIAGIAGGLPCGEAAAAALDLDAEFDLVAAFASLLHHHVLSFEH